MDMNDLFKKLNTLVKASINDILGDDLAIGGPRRKPLNPERLGKNIDSEIEALRQRVNDAIAYEDDLQAQVQKLNDEVARWDKQADDALKARDDSAAHYAVEQMQRAQQRLDMAQADLREHQLVTQELIQRVNTLDAVVADARRTQQENVEAEEAPVEPAASSSPTQALSDMLQEARQAIGRVGDKLTSMTEPSPAPTETSEEISEADESVDEAAVDDDLERRRQRLSKPD
jgi:phage shock protein A